MKTTLSLRRLTLLSAIALPLILGACASSSKDKPVDIACPPVETPAQLATLAKNGISANLRVSGSTCKVDGEKVTMKVDIELTASRSPSVKNPEISVPFFAAITDQGDQLLNKKLYETTFSFSDEDMTAREQLALEFTFTKAQAGTTRVTLGYQLGQDAWLKIKR